MASNHDDLGFVPAAASHDDLGFQETPTPSAKQDDGGALQTLDDAARGAVGGLTFGFNDEIAGGLGAGADLLTGKTSLEKIVDAYRQNRDETRALDHAAQERSPYANAAGNIVGSIAPALLTGGGSALAEGAGVTARMLGAAKTGLGAGALSGLGTSEADSISGDLNNAAEGAKMGALFGGALQGGVEAAKGAGALVRGAANTKLGKDIVDSFKLGKSGTDIVSAKGLDVAEEKAREAAAKLGLGAEQTRKAAGVATGEAKDAIRASGKTFDVAEQVEKVKGLITKLKASDDPNAIKDVTFLQNYLDNLLLGKEVEMPIQHSKFTPGKEIQAKPSATEVLEAQAAKEKASAAALGQKLNTTIVPSEDEAGNRLLTLLKHSDENVGASERAIPIKGEDGNIAGHELDLGDGVNNKTSASAKTIFDTPAVEGGFTPSERGQLVTETKKVRLGGSDPQQVSFDKAQDIKDTLNGFNGTKSGTPSLNTDTAINEVKQIAKSVNDKVTQIPELAVSNKNYAASKQALEGLGLSADDFVRDAATGQIRLDPTAKQKLNGIVRRMARDTDAGDNAAEKLSESLRLMREANPKIADAIGPEVESASRTLDLAQKAKGLGLLNKSTYIKSGGINVANRAGQAVSAIGQDIAPVANSIGKSISAASPNELKQVAQWVMQKGPSGMKLASEISDALKKDNVGRNAALFTLQQNPSYRQMLNEHSKDDSQK